MSVIRDYINSQLIEPLKSYPTTIQDTLITIISDRLEELYNYTKEFPEILTPNTNRLDILQAILKQFQFTIREEADIHEQVAILENILEVYSKRGSIDTIENMWKYYGGDLPKDVEVNIPASYLFRYNLSSFSGTHVFPDSETYRSGVYEIILHNSNYPTDKLKDFMLKELVAAGTRIYFTNSLYNILTGDSSYNYNVSEDTFIMTDLRTTSYRSGLVFSGIGEFSRNNEASIWSGRADLFVEITQTRELGPKEFEEILKLGGYSLHEGIIQVQREKAETVIYTLKVVHDSVIRDTEFRGIVSYTSEEKSIPIERYLYDINGDLVSSTHPGYFVLGETLLGNEVL